MPDLYTAYAGWQAATRPADAPPPGQQCVRYGAALRAVYDALTAPAPAGLQAVLQVLRFDATNASTALRGAFPSLPGVIHIFFLINVNSTIHCCTDEAISPALQAYVAGILLPRQGIDSPGIRIFMQHVLGTPLGPASGGLLVTRTARQWLQLQGVLLRQKRCLYRWRAGMFRDPVLAELAGPAHAVVSLAVGDASPTQLFEECSLQVCVL